MARPRTFRLENTPIPTDAKPYPTWPASMLEMAAHIGPYATLLLVDAFAGQDVYVPLDPKRSPFTDIIGAEKAEIIAHVYGREKLPIPTGRNPLLRARRQGIIAAARAGKISKKEAAAILRTPRAYFSRLFNQTDEGTDAMPVAELMRPRDTRQLEMFDDPDATE